MLHNYHLVSLALKTAMYSLPLRSWVWNYPRSREIGHWNRVLYNNEDARIIFHLSASNHKLLEPRACRLMCTSIAVQYGSDASPINVSVEQSLEFVVIIARPRPRPRPRQWPWPRLFLQDQDFSFDNRLLLLLLLSSKTEFLIFGPPQQLS